MLEEITIQHNSNNGILVGIIISTYFYVVTVEWCFNETGLVKNRKDITVVVRKLTVDIKAGEVSWMRGRQVAEQIPFLFAIVQVNGGGRFVIGTLSVT